ncbi:uncharacterized protein LOC123546131 [Mercenaria mercenaria]|uniref:uncharacterized protein LOC123546131 n=1 Tax=Mercenaria mercenaria TaxID=6596 RepID=UPI00234E56C3|nr:uncharacterized protein LOC123546131 [Mercenaria mercenaria]
MRWDSTTDEMLFPQRSKMPMNDCLLTKRKILKESSSIYDPLGLLSPITVKGKILRQLLWKRNFEWDEVLPDDIIREWCKIRGDIAKATETKFCRRYFPNASSTDVALHYFSDASTKAYGACAYLVSGNQSTLIMAKNRVTPVKQLTIPKLELCAALIGSRLSQHITSTIDCTKIVDESIWLKDDTSFPQGDCKLIVYDSCENESESSNSETAVLTSTQSKLPNPSVLEIIDIQRFSSYRKLLRVTAYVIRFVNNCRNVKKSRGPLESHEINTAARQLIKHVQDIHFHDVKQYLSQKEKRCTTIPNLVRQLDLFLDEDNLIRCGGRISNAPLLDSTKFPYLLPSRNNFTDLIVMDAHITQLHSGTESTVTFIRQKFWIPSIRQHVRKIIRSCVTCRKVTSSPYRVPDPPPLPSDRVKHAPPFTVTGIDFTGALTVKASDGNLQKAYICLFTCANTRAIHLEIVPNMTVDSFILALRRFFSRRPIPKIIMSDNALTYISTAKLLKTEILGTYGITWKFIPQHAPWYGGWWERLIGVTKTSIKKVLGKSLVSLEVLQTIVTEVECIVNDRTLTHISTDPTDEEPLTPSHLLYGRRITSPVLPRRSRSHSRRHFPTILQTNFTGLSLQTIEHFWSRWKHEYLTSLRQFHKMSGNHGDTVTVGDVVQIHDNNLRRNRWSLGVIEDVVTGRDGLIRAAHIRSRRGVTMRPIAKLYPLELK